MLKSYFNSQFFTYDIIEIINEVNTSYLQSELSIFALSKIRLKNDKSFYLLLALLLGDIRDLKQNMGRFNNGITEYEPWVEYDCNPVLKIY